MAFGITAGTWLMAGVAGAGALASSNAAGNAADAQSAAAAQSDATQRYQYDTTRADNAPFRETGLQANNKLAQLMGLGSSQTRDQFRNSLLSQYTTPGVAGTSGGYATIGDEGSDHLSQRWMDGSAGTASSIDENGLNTAVDARMAEQAQQQSDPAYGSLTRKFSTADMNADPVYQSGLKFGLDQGTQGINRQAAAGGNFLSGATLKALTRFGNDYGSTKANESYNRFNNDQTNQYNKLSNLSGAGQLATNQVSAAGQNMANQIGQSQQNAGDARASGYMGQAKAWNNGLSGAVNAFQQNSLMNSFGGGSSGTFQPSYDASGMNQSSYTW